MLRAAILHESQNYSGGGGGLGGSEKNRGTVITLACSKRSDSGERCEVKKAMKSRGGLSPLSERLE